MFTHQTFDRLTAISCFSVFEQAHFRFLGALMLVDFGRFIGWSWLIEVVSRCFFGFAGVFVLVWSQKDDPRAFGGCFWASKSFAPPDRLDSSSF